MKTSISPSDESQLWTRGLDALDAFIAKRGHAFVPPSHLTADGWRLGSFVVAARRASFRGALPPAIEAGLAQRGIDRAAGAEAFAEGLERLEAFRAREGHCIVPVVACEPPDGFRLGEWRVARFAERDRGALRGQRLAVLERIGMFTAPVRRQGRPRLLAGVPRVDGRSSPDGAAARHARVAAFSAERFEIGLAELHLFVNREGHAAVPARYETPGEYRLGQWCWWVRGRRRGGRLPAERIAILDALGFVWAPRETAFRKGLREFLDTSVRTPGFDPATWIRQQRKRRAAGRLTSDQIAELDRAGFAWTEPSVAEQRFAEGLAALDRHLGGGGGTWVPSQFVAADGFRIGCWLRDERTAMRTGRRSAAQRDALAARCVTDSHGADRNRHGLASLARYRERHPGAIPPIDFHDTDGFGLGTWFLVRRREAREGVVDAALRVSFEAMGVELDGWARPRVESREALFSSALAAYRGYVARTGRRSPPRGERMPDGRDLSVWVMNLRLSWQLGRLSEERVATIEQAGLTFDYTPRGDGTAAFEAALAALRAFVAENGHDRVPPSMRLVDGRRLAGWCQTMRHRVRIGSISESRSQALIAAGLAVSLPRHGRPAVSRPIDRPLDHIGGRLHEFRVERGISLDDLAIAIGISGATIRSIEQHRPRRPMRLALVGRIADVLGMDRPLAASLAGWPEAEVEAVFGVAPPHDRAA